jgi:signal transduction histidine kinase
VKLSTRLLFPLLALVTLMTALYGAWTIQMRGRTLLAEAKRETEAYAVALGITLEYAEASRDPLDVEDIVGRITREPRIYSVFVYGVDGRLRYYSSPQGATLATVSSGVREVLARGKPLSQRRRTGGTHFYSVLRPIRGRSGEPVGALEVKQPLSVMEREATRTRQRLTLYTLLLLAAVTLLIRWVVHRTISGPLAGLVSGARALGRGELAHRIDAARGPDELSVLAREFNRMALHLEETRDRMVQETEERIALMERLREAEKLADVGRLAAGLAHEIAAPLHVVTGRAEMMLRGETAPVQKRNLGIIVQQAERITGIVRGLLDYARRRDPSLRPLSLDAAIESVREFLEGELERAGVRLVVEGTRGAMVYADAHLLHQVFINLFLNAVHALQSVEAERRIVVRTRGEGQAVVVEVEDSGRGFPEELLPRVFEPFVTTKARGSGTGLGLAVVRAIMEEHGGSIEAENRGRGALLRLTFIAAPSPEAAHA